MAPIIDGLTLSKLLIYKKKLDSTLTTGHFQSFLLDFYFSHLCKIPISKELVTLLYICDVFKSKGVEHCW